jgi:rare lipoprotein A
MILEDGYDVIIKKGIFNNKEINRVWISGFRSEEEVKDFKEKNSLAGAMIIAE